MINKIQLKVNMNVFLECEEGTTQEEAEKQLDDILDSVQTISDHRVTFSEFEHSLIQDVKA